MEDLPLKELNSIKRVLCAVKNKTKYGSEDKVTAAMLLTRKVIGTWPRSDHFGDVDLVLTRKGKRLVKAFRC